MDIYFSFGNLSVLKCYFEMIEGLIAQSVERCADNAKV